MNLPQYECVADSVLTDAIEARSSLLRIHSKRVLFRQGQEQSRLFLLKEGEVVLTSRLLDNSVLGFRAVPGSLIGLQAIACNRPYSMTATVTRYSELHAISIWTYREIVGTNPRLSSRIEEMLSPEIRPARCPAFRALSIVIPQVSRSKQSVASV